MDSLIFLLEIVHQKIKLIHAHTHSKILTHFQYHSHFADEKFVLTSASPDRVKSEEGEILYSSLIKTTLCFHTPHLMKRVHDKKLVPQPAATKNSLINFD